MGLIFSTNRTTSKCNMCNDKVFSKELPDFQEFPIDIFMFRIRFLLLGRQSNLKNKIASLLLRNLIKARGSLMRQKDDARKQCRNVHDLSMWIARHSGM